MTSIEYIFQIYLIILLVVVALAGLAWRAAMCNHIYKPLGEPPIPIKDKAIWRSYYRLKYRCEVCGKTRWKRSRTFINRRLSVPDGDHPHLEIVYT